MSDRAFIGDDFVINFPAAKDATGELVSLAGATLFCSARTGTATKVTATTTSVDEAKGTSKATFSAATTLGWAASSLYKYDGVVRLASGEFHTVGQGSFTATARITANP